MQYGYFDDKNLEYVITDPLTPVKWINYVGTLAFGGLVDHTGGALICKGDPAINRITKYIPQLPSSEFKGETLYLRRHDKDGYHIFSPYYVPTLDTYDRYECHVGMGYTRIVSEFYGIRTDVTIFVSRDDTRVIRDIKVTNTTAAPVTLDAVPVVEYTHSDAAKQFINGDWVPQTMQSKAHRINNHLVLTQYAFMRRETNVNFLTASLPATSFESDRKKFLGKNEYGTWADPLSLHQPELSCYEALRGDNIGALLIPLGTIPPGETRRLITQLGQISSLKAGLPDIRKFWKPAAVDKAFAALAAFWQKYLSTITVETPSASLNSMLNVHNPRQCHTTYNWSRYLSLYQLGLGARGIGFRDSSQDVMGVLAHIPDEARALICQMLHVQRRNGSAKHQYNPLSMIATNGEAPDDLPYYSDDHLWIILAICAYLRETGDMTLLDEVIPYYEKDEAGNPLEVGTVRDHIQRGIEFTHNNTGAHGLPLLGFADWNDTVHLGPRAESLFSAALYGKALLELIALAEYQGDAALIEQYVTYYEEMKQRINEQCWDGAWYLRYFDAEGLPVGSHTNTAGQIYTNGQSWPVLSGFATPERARLALDSVRDRLNTRHGIKLSAPGFDGFDPAIGGITTYPPGAKENGGIFLHANPWVIIAETMLGRSERAFEYYNQINPAAKNDIIEEYECEPYVYAQNILGDEHSLFGLARNSWLSGTASWMYQAGIQYILGVLPTYQGLQINPCIPPEWNGFNMTRRCRGDVYKIEVKNPHHVGQGVKTIRVDGLSVEGNIIPFAGDGAVHQVEVVLG